MAAVLVALVVPGCTSLVSLALRTSCDWQFIQSVGGIALGTPQRDHRGHVLLPIRCDVSGLETITVRPTALNSGLVCEPPLVRVRGNTVFLTVRTSIPTKRSRYASCPAADLGALPAGGYTIIYRSPDETDNPLGSILVPGPASYPH